jgi:hypothetical protein
MLLRLPSKRRKWRSLPLTSRCSWVGGRSKGMAYFFFWPSPLLEAGPLAFPIVLRGVKDFFHLE